MADATCWLKFAFLLLCQNWEIQPAECTWKSRIFPCDIKVNESGTEIFFQCNERKLKDLPDGITPNATKLDLSENFIPNISNNALSNLENLTHLYLNWVNQGKVLKPIAEDAFKNLTNLKELHFKGNRLTEIPSNLPPNLELLELDHNNILSLNRTHLKGIQNVTELSLSKNCYFWNPCGKTFNVTNYSLSIMTKLQNLTLSYNNLTHVPKGLPQSLQTLALSSNRIEYISENDFDEVPFLKILELQGNCPRCSNAPYPCVSCPNISLSIHPHAFANLTHLETLHLAGNSLKTLQTSWFFNLRNLKCLYLSFNFLADVITGEMGMLNHLSSLEKIDLSFNFGVKSYPLTVNLSRHFSNLTSLRTLHLEGLVFRQIGHNTLSPLYGLRNLSALNLATNFIVRSNSTIFSKFSNLKLIYLGENRLYPVSVGGAPGPDQNINMRLDSHTPYLTNSYQKDFVYELSHRLVRQKCFDSGRVLSLSSNNIFYITPKQFEGYGDIACLNLSRNGFAAALNGTEFTSLPNLTYLDLSFNKIDLAYDTAFKELKKLEVLDLSYNPHYFEVYGVTHNLNFLRNLPVLRVLNMSRNFISTLTTKKMSSESLNELQFQHNNLGTLWKGRDGSYNSLFQNLTNLTILDISFNNIEKIERKVYKHFPVSLIYLSISNNKLIHFPWEVLGDFKHLQILDLSFNLLSDVPANISKLIPTSLNMLILSHNTISQFSNGLLRIQTVDLSFNSLTIINESSLSGSKNDIGTLLLHNNPFQCTCDLLEFIVWIDRNNVKIPKLTTEVKCNMPANRYGQPVILFDIKQCIDPDATFWRYVLSSSISLLTMLTAITAHVFYWDASYILYYLKAKLKGYHSLTSSESFYEAFISYDTRDTEVSEWVMEHLRVQLEVDGDNHLPLCLEERDWTPGVPLIENLSQSIRHSRKTVFVLTEAYIKTGSFRLAVYLAHQRLLEDNVDVIVLLLLEPVLQHSPFLNLRRRLCGKSVVEWPRTAAAEAWFWQNLRNAVRVDNHVMYSDIYSRYFTNNK